ncbi:MAG: hypothetical protein ACRDM0_25280, partial [Thermoleophilaceae bacterium]
LARSRRAGWRRAQLGKEVGQHGQGKPRIPAAQRLVERHRLDLGMGERANEPDLDLLALVIQDGMRRSFGLQGQPYPAPAELAGSLALGSAAYPTYRLFVIAFSLAACFLVWYAIERTRLGALDVPGRLRVIHTPGHTPGHMDAELVLAGHGPPWRQGPAAAVARPEEHPRRDRETTELMHMDDADLARRSRFAAAGSDRARSRPP